MNNRVRRDSGFTLLEMILGFMVFGVIASSLFMVFHNGVVLNKRARAVEHISREVHWSLKRIQRDIENAVVYDFKSTYPDKRSFQAYEDTLMLIIPTASGLMYVRYFLDDVTRTTVAKTVIGTVSTKPINQVLVNEKGQDVMMLVRETRPLKDWLQGKEDNITRDILAMRVAPHGLRFSFAVQEDAEEAEDVWRWYDQWDEYHLPVMARVGVTFVLRADPYETWDVQRDVFLPLGALHEE